MKQPLSLFAIILLLASSGQVAADLYLPSLPAIAHGLMSRINLVQLSVSLYMVGFAFSQLIYGPLSDGIGRKKPLLAGLLLLLIGSIICLTAPSVTWLIIGRCLQGAGAGGGVALSRSILRDVYSGNNLAKFGSYLAVGGVAIMACAPLIGGYIQHTLNWRANFGFLTLYTLATLLIVVIKLPETNQHISQHHLHYKQVLQNLFTLFTHKVFFGMSVIIFMAYASILAWLTTGPVLLQVKAGLTPVDFGWIAVLTGLSYGVGGISNGKLVLRYGLKTMLSVGLIFMLLGSLSMLIISFFIAKINGWGIVVPIVLFIGGTGFVFSNAFACALGPFAKIAGIAGSIFGFMQILGGAVSSALIAHLPQNNQLPLSLLLLFATMIALIFFWKIYNEL